MNYSIGYMCMSYIIAMTIYTFSNIIFTVDIKADTCTYVAMYLKIHTYVPTYV